MASCRVCESRHSRFSGRSEESPAYGHDHLRDVVTEIEAAVQPFVEIVDWDKKTDVQRQMRGQIKRRLPNEAYSREEQERLAAALIDLLRARRGR